MVAAAALRTFPDSGYITRCERAYPNRVCRAFVEEDLYRRGLEDQWNAYFEALYFTDFADGVLGHLSVYEWRVYPFGRILRKHLGKDQ